MQIDELNRADIQQLEQISGIGPHLARRIVQHRPFTSWEEVLRVPGIGPHKLRLLQTYPNGVRTMSEKPPSNDPMATESTEVEELTPRAEDLVERDSEQPEASQEISVSDIFEGQSEPEHPAEEGAQGEGESQSDVVAVLPEAVGSERAPEEGLTEEEPSPLQPDRSETYITARQAWQIAIISATFGFLLAVLVTLGILFSINATLRYGAYTDLFQVASTVANMQDQVGRMDNRLTEMETQISAFETRLQRLEDLPERVNAVEQTTQEVSQQVDSLSDTVQTLKDTVEKTQTFFLKLRGLLDDIFGTPDNRE